MIEDENEELSEQKDFSGASNEPNRHDENQSANDLKEICFFKFKFQIENTNQYCAGLVSVDLRTHQIIKNEFLAASYTYSLENINVYKPWYDFSHKLTTIKINIDSVTSIETDLRNSIASRVDKSAISDINDYLKNGNDDYIKDIFLEIFQHLFAEENLPLDYNIEIISEQDFIEDQGKLKALNEKPSTSQEGTSALLANKMLQANDKFYEVPLGHETLECQPILAPVSGRPIYDFKKGDMIMVRVNSSRVKKNLFVMTFVLFLMKMEKKSLLVRPSKK